MTSALWTGCGLVTKCRGERQSRQRGAASMHGQLQRPGCSPDRRATSGGGRVVHAQFGAPRKPGQLTHSRHHGGSLSTSTHGGKKPKHKTRHLWLWTGKNYLHLEPQGRREVAPGQFAPYQGKTLGRLRGWHVTPPNPHVVHPPPPPHGMRTGDMVPGRPIHHAGHYGYSAVLGKPAWISSHDNLSLDPKMLPPQIRGPIMRAIKAASSVHPQSHTAWGVTGHRVNVIPGHWMHEPNGSWQYVERHTDMNGRPSTVKYPAHKAPSAAFGPRPPYLPPLHFWPHGGQFRNAKGQAPSNAPGSVEMPPHARFAHANGLLPAHDPYAAALARQAFTNVNAGTSQDVLGRPMGGGMLRRYAQQQRAARGV